ncbi:MAG: hypothetical protein D3925_13425, partial [Candidatus Electrothrix sp. AR5]|nr:hypothetical protein [Candidatus Electrothrix sp. AR5]
CLVGLAGVSYAQAENIKIPLPTEDVEIQSVVDSVRAGVDVKAMMRQTRDRIKEEQAKRLPFLRPIGDAISEVVSTRVRQETRDRTRKTQMAAMQDPMNPAGMPEFIAPRFD